MPKEKICVYSVALNYRMSRQFKGQRWHPKFKWRSKSYIVRCHSENEAVQLIQKQFNDTHKAEYDFKTNHILKIT